MYVYGTIKITSHIGRNISFEMVDVSLDITEAELYHFLLISPQVRHDLLFSCKTLGWIFTHTILHHYLFSLPLIIPLWLSDEEFTMELHRWFHVLFNQMM